MANPCVGAGCVVNGAEFPPVGFNTKWIALQFNNAVFNPTTQTATAAIYVYNRASSETYGLSGNQQVGQFYGTNLTGMCIPETYHTTSEDFFGSTLFWANVNNDSRGQMQLSTITYDPSTGFPGYPRLGVAFPEAPSGGWTEVDGSVYGPTDDRVTGCVERNRHLYLVHDIAVNGNSEQAAVQWWDLGLSLSPFRVISKNVSTVGSGYGVLSVPASSGGIGVNSHGDMIVPFTTSNNVTGSPFPSAAYVVQLAGNPPYNPFVFAQGQSTVTPPIIRTGDYAHAMADPTDDYTFYLTAGFSGSNQTDQTQWAFVAPPIARFVARAVSEAECTNTGNTCTVTVNTPANSLPGDVFLAVHTQGTYVGFYNTPSLPPGWSFLPFANGDPGSSPPFLVNQSENVCGDSLVSFMMAHTYAAGDPSSFSFSLPVFNFADCNGGGLVGEDGVYLVSYRGASPNFAGYTAYGYGFFGNISTLTAAQVSVPPYSTLVNIFQGLSTDAAEDGNANMSFAVPSGTPGLRVETPLSPVFPFLDADIWSGAAGGTFGPYSTTSTLNGTVLRGLQESFQVLVPHR